MSKKILNFFLNAVSILMMLLIFLCVFSVEYPALNNLSRTLVVFLGSFIMAFGIFDNIFGTFQFGELKSKPITYTTALAIFFTDLVAYISILIMSTNPNNPEANRTFIVENLNLLLITFIIQTIVILIGAYVGNYIYFKLFKPKKTLIISRKNSNDKYVKYLEKHKKQYEYIGKIDYSEFNSETVDWNIDLVVLVDLPIEVRKEISSILFLENIDFIFTTEVSDVILYNGSPSIYSDIPVIEVNTNKITFMQKFTKRTLDIVFSLAAIIVTLPFWIIIILAIKLDDKGPIFFKQERKTINGKIFKVLKFRTMKVGSKNYSATENDDRITKVGNILRKIRMDELPQFLNILKGDMSIVGPRPEMLENISQYEHELPEFRYRLKMKAGLTGYAQIEGKYNTSPKEKLIMDLSYIENYSIWLDLRLMFRTLIVFFKKDSVDGF